MSDRFAFGRRSTVVVGVGLALGAGGLGAAASPLARARTVTPVAPARPAPPGAAHCPGGASVTGIFLYGGERLVSETDIPVCVTGRLAVTFAGSAATGCAARGLCAYHGTETWKPPAAGDLSIATLAGHNRRTTSATLFLGGFGKPVSSVVQRTVPGAATTTCRDRTAGDGGFFTIAIAGGRVRINPARADEPVFGTACAGPLDADLAAALPHTTLAFARLARGHLHLDLSGRAPFAAHGFAGTVDSTLALTLGRPHREPLHPKVPNPPGTTPQRLETVNYRITQLGGQTVASVRASGSRAACAPLDACGLHGTLTVASHATRPGAASLVATAPARRPRRDLATALGLADDGNPTGISVDGAGQIATPGTLDATLTQDGAVCRDQVRLSQTQIELRRHGGRLVVTESPAPSQAADALRTRCPGPLLGHHHALARATLPASDLSRPTLTVALHGTAFAAGPYRVATRSTVTLTLHRVRVRSRIIPF